MTPRQRRMSLVGGIVVGVGIAGALALSAFRSNVTFFFDPTAVAAGQVKNGEHFRLGGMVTKGSVKRTPGSLEVHFVVTDFKHDVPVTYSGVLPDLFREGTGVVAHGSMQTDGTFRADEVLAKHDEKYMPPEVAKSLKRRHGEAREGALDAPDGGPSSAAEGQGKPAGAAQSPSTTRTSPSNAGGTQAPPTTSTLPSTTRAQPSTTRTQASDAGSTQSPPTASLNPRPEAARSTPNVPIGDRAFITAAQTLNAAQTAATAVIAKKPTVAGGASATGS
jgi:cytochrome c-type biogenesis protein CcmE